MMKMTAATLAIMAMLLVSSCMVPVQAAPPIMSQGPAGAASVARGPDANPATLPQAGAALAPSGENKPASMLGIEASVASTHAFPAPASACGVSAYYGPGDSDTGCPVASNNAGQVELAPAAVVSPGGGASAVSGPAKGQVLELTGSEQRFFGPPTSVWTANGWTEVRDVHLTGNFAFRGPGIKLSGSETVLTNATLDSTNNGWTWGENTYTDEVTGLVCKGAVNGKITDALGTLTVVAPCSNGALLVGTVKDVSTDPPNVAPPKSVKSDFSGVLISPPKP